VTLHIDNTIATIYNQYICYFAILLRGIREDTLMAKTETNSNFPEYATDIYKILCEFAIRMGLELVYKESSRFPEHVLAYTETCDFEDGRHNLVFMPKTLEKITAAGKIPETVLAHEISHWLIDDFYASDAMINAETSFLHHFIRENDCDRMGLAIYLLAEAIVNEEV